MEESALKAFLQILQKVIENIDSPYVWMPLGLFVLGVLAYCLTKHKMFIYFSLGFMVLAFGADWVGRWQNRQTQAKPTVEAPSYRNDIFIYLNSVQAKSVKMLEAGKEAAARDLISKNYQAIDEARKNYPDDPNFHMLMGYTLKDMYQSSKKLLPREARQNYLVKSQQSFEKALQIDPKLAGAYNGLANVDFFQGKIDTAIKNYDKALALNKGNYPQAEQDKAIAIRVKKKEIPFEF